MHSAEASANSVAFCSEPLVRLGAKRGGQLRLKRCAMEPAGMGQLEVAAIDVSGGGGGARLVHGYASSSNLSASTEVTEEREPVQPKRVRRTRGSAVGLEACSGDSEVQPSCSTRCGPTHVPGLMISVLSGRQ